MSTILNEEVTTQMWLRDYLAADATLMSYISDVWYSSMPESAPMPVVKIDRQEASDLYTVNLYRAWASLLFLVRGIVHWKGSGQQDWTTAKQIADRLDVLLHKHTETTSNGLEVSCWREESYVDEQPLADGTLAMYCGGMYRITAHAT